MQGLAGVETVHSKTEDEGNGGVEEFGRDENTEGSENSFSYFWFVSWPDIGCQTLEYQYLSLGSVNNNNIFTLSSSPVR